MNSALDALGTGLARTYVAYAGLLLAIPAYFCIHAIVMLVVARSVSRGPRDGLFLRMTRRGCEVIYGLINPAIAAAAWTLAALAPLYVIPALLIVFYLGALTGREGEQSGFLLLRGGFARRALATIGVIVAATLVLGALRGSDPRITRLTLAHRDEIVRASQEFDVDAGTIAAILYVTHRHQLSPFQASLERIAMAAWLEDADSHIGLAERLNISIGLTQIKPVTAQTAVTILEMSARRDRIHHYKQYREVPQLAGDWILPASVTAFEPPFDTPATKADVVRALLDDRMNVRTCAFILALYQAQWRARSPESDIRHRPDILATLFQIGFERSHPHRAPQANAFGRQVLEAYRSPWLRDAFVPNQLVRD